ncbi:FAD-dependent oxidoreductase [Streptomyces sp. NPDC046977]|uniref:FAD-binding oxidoreductase n=1 Tax=Streptomyces sp. NPDC046977 TaxID=3154703 RepID=UPI0033CE7BBA
MQTNDNLKDVLDEFADTIEGPVFTPDSAGYEKEISVFNLSVTHHPAVVVGATCPADVAQAVLMARRAGLGVAVLRTGHGPTLPAGQDTLVVNTSRMSGIAIDAAARTACVEAGVLSGDLAEAAAEYGLAALVGSSPGVGIVGYTLSGGASLTLGRMHGWACDHVLSMGVVTADGELHQVSGSHEPELFGALLGGKSNFGVVTSMTMSLFPVTRLYAGSLFFSGADARAVLEAYRELTGNAPDELTSALAIFNFPPLPNIPEFMHGMTVSVRLSYLGDPAAADVLLAPLRAAAPVLADTVGQIGPEDFASISNDPVEPAAAVEHFALLRHFEPATIDSLLEVVGIDSGTSVNIVDIRHLGGAFANPPRTRNAVGARDTEFAMFALTVVPPGLPVESYANAGMEVLERLAPWLRPGKHPSFLSPADTVEGGPARAYDAATLHWLRGLKAQYDPGNTFRTNHNITPAG